MIHLKSVYKHKHIRKTSTFRIKTGNIERLNMDETATKALIVVILSVLCAVSSGLECYTCSVWDVPLSEPNGDADCFNVANKTATASMATEMNCTACVADSFTKLAVVDYMNRYCWTGAADECVSGEAEVKTTDTGISVLDNTITDIDVNRKCCTTDKCNAEMFTSAASVMSATKILSIFITIFAIYNTM